MAHQLLEKLSNAFGPPGFEDEVREIVRTELSAVADFSYDKMGSLVAIKKGAHQGPKVLLVGHMDEVAFVVQNITSQGFIKFHTLGGWWEHTVLAQRLIIRTRKGDIEGIVGAKPVHHLTAAEKNGLIQIKDMFLDVGATSKEEALEMGIELGSPIVPLSKYTPMKNPSLVMGKAFDDRVGVCLMTEICKELFNESLKVDLHGGASVQEEVGTRGAKTIAALVKPDLAIVLEGTPADDSPGFNREESQALLGKGPQMRLLDPTALANRKLTTFVKEIAKKENLSVQVAVRISGGTDAKEIHLFDLGVPTVVLAVPVRYIHSHVGVMNLKDYDETKKLLLALVRALDEKTIEEFVRF